MNFIPVAVVEKATKLERIPPVFSLLDVIDLLNLTVGHVLVTECKNKRTRVVLTFQKQEDAHQLLVQGFPASLNVYCSPTSNAYKILVQKVQMAYMIRPPFTSMEIQELCDLFCVTPSVQLLRKNGRTRILVKNLRPEDAKQLVAIGNATTLSSGERLLVTCSHRSSSSSSSNAQATEEPPTDIAAKPAIYEEPIEVSHGQQQQQQQHMNLAHAASQLMLEERFRHIKKEKQKFIRHQASKLVEHIRTVSVDGPRVAAAFSARVQKEEALEAKRNIRKEFKEERRRAHRANGGYQRNSSSDGAHVGNGADDETGDKYAHLDPVLLRQAATLAKRKFSCRRQDKKKSFIGTKLYQYQRQELDQAVSRHHWDALPAVGRYEC